MALPNNSDSAKLDPSGVEKALELFPEQIKITFGQAYSSDIPLMSPNGVVVSGMGGSSNAAKIIQGLYEKELKFKFEVFNDYGLPSWLDEYTLVVANSYSGNTEETLSAIEVANKVGSKILGIATGGKIGEMVKSGAIHGAVISPGDTNPTGFPKTGLGVSLGGLIGALSKAGILNITESDLDESLKELVEIRKTWNAKEAAEFIHGGMPILFGGRPLIGALNAGRNAMCEISRNLTQFYDFPEVNHVLIEATMKPDFVKEKSRYIFFNSDFYNDRVKLRFQITQEIFNKQGLKFQEYKLKSKTTLGQALELAHYCAWIGFHISMLDGVDPGPEPWIIELKNKLSQPVH